ALHRVVRPVVSSLVAVLLVAAAAGIAAAGYAAAGDDHPRRIAGAALLGAPNGVWLGVSVGLFVPWDARGDGALLGALPRPLDDLLRTGTEEPVTLGALAELDGRVWLLGLGAATAMLLAGVLTGVRTPVWGAPGAGGFAARCAVRLGAATAVTLPVLVWLTEVSVGASLSVLGYEAFAAGLDLSGRLGAAALLGAVWGAAAGAVGALLAWACGVAGTRVAVLARGAGDERSSVPAPSGPYRPGLPYRPPDPDTNPYLRLPGARTERGAPEDAVPGRSAPGDMVPDRSAPGDTVPGRSAPGDTVPDRSAPGDTVPGRSAPGDTGGGADDVAAAPTVAGPAPPPRPPRPDRRRLWPDRVPPPPPPPPAPRPSGAREPEGGDEGARGSGGR
ncbi:streptophobe family protein, partial [Streptomyces griseoincarnatus]